MFNKEMVFRATRSSRSVDLMLSRKIRSLSRVLSLSSSSSSSAKRRVVSQSVRALMVVVFNRLRCVALTRDFSTCTMYMYVFFFVYDVCTVSGLDTFSQQLFVRTVSGLETVISRCLYCLRFGNRSQQESAGACTVSGLEAVI